MPTERFYRLPEEKKQNILRAAFKEFARVPYEKVSINQIIQNSDISRGSFYTYFFDKQDLVEFLMRDNYEQMKKMCKEELETNNGDFFAMVELMFEFFVKKMQKTKELIDFARNIFANQENAQLLGIRDWPCPGSDWTPSQEEFDSVMWMYDDVDQSAFCISSQAEFFDMVMLAMSSLAISLKQYYEYPQELENVRKALRRKLDMLKYGVYRREAERKAEKSVGMENRGN